MDFFQNVCFKENKNMMLEKTDRVTANLLIILTIMSVSYQME